MTVAAIVTGIDIHGGADGVNSVVIYINYSDNNDDDNDDDENHKGDKQWRWQPIVTWNWEKLDWGDFL